MLYLIETYPSFYKKYVLSLQIKNNKLFKYFYWYWYHWRVYGFEVAKVTIISPKKEFAQANQALVLTEGLSTEND